MFLTTLEIRGKIMEKVFELLQKRMATNLLFENPIVSIASSCVMDSKSDCHLDGDCG